MLPHVRMNICMHVGVFCMSCMDAIFIVHMLHMYVFIYQLNPASRDLSVHSSNLHGDREPSPMVQQTAWPRCLEVT